MAGLLKTLPVIVFTVWFERVVDPILMISPIPVFLTARFLHPGVHYTHLLLLSAVALWWAGRSFRFELPRPRKYAIAFCGWFVVVNALGWWTLRAEFAEYDLVEKGTPEVPRVKPLLCSAKIWIE